MGFPATPRRSAASARCGGFGFACLALDCKLNLKVALKEQLLGGFASRNSESFVHPGRGSRERVAQVWSRALRGQSAHV